MESIFRWFLEGPAQIVLRAIFASLGGIGLLLAYILIRRAYRRRYFDRVDAAAFLYRQRLDDILSGKLPAREWRFRRHDREVVEDILLASLELAPEEHVRRVQECLRSSGLLDQEIREARHAHGWRRERALVRLGATRAPEAVPALAEALDDRSPAIQFAGLRGAGRSRLFAAGREILMREAEGKILPPGPAVQNALLSCCQGHAEEVMTFLRQCDGSARDTLARVLAELVTPDLGEELLVLAGDGSPEIRAAVARAFSHCSADFALPALGVLASGEEWFVRLRAVMSLGSFADPRAIPALLDAVCDSNRLVRQRAAAALASCGQRTATTLEQVIATGDRYALQAFISELDRSESLEELFDELVQRARLNPGAAAALEVLEHSARLLLVAGRTAEPR